MIFFFLYDINKETMVQKEHISSINMDRVETINFISVKTDLVGQHGFSSVTHDVLGVAGLLAVDEDDSSQPANHAHRPGPYQLLLSYHRAAVRQYLHHACRDEERISTERLIAQV